ncbi:Glycoside hydrolase, family 76 [Penicillium roqueforti FM164]|uniref:mannan endo-1,6-alpha-mannosidase n=1 Tax=Penicillium roqueforti (strain FM164) TaxID=1365484 RepID=W6Q2L6_PENRF|nr:Glycoside hydrolase, family 76 [Penicillium roqueforti FM164]
MIYCHLGYAAWLMSSLTRVSAIDLDINSTESIQNAATIQVTNLLSNSTIDGSVSPLSDDPFHGVKDEASVYITLLAFWDTTKNSNYNNLVIDRMDSQRPTIFNSSYNSTNTRPSTAIWGLAAMTAAEVGFPTDSSESWFNCAVNLHSKLMWKSGHFCTDGLSPDSQNLIGQQFGYLTGTYFQLTSRIAYASSGEQRRFFADRASAVWSWSVKNHILNESDWTINSLVAGMDNNTACFVLKDWRLASSYGLWLSGAAYMFKMVSCLRREVLLALLFEFSCCSFCRPKGSIEC